MAVWHKLEGMIHAPIKDHVSLQKIVDDIPTQDSILHIDEHVASQHAPYREWTFRWVFIGDGNRCIELFLERIKDRSTQAQIDVTAHVRYCL